MAKKTPVQPKLIRITLVKSPIGYSSVTKTPSGRSACAACTRQWSR